MSVARAVAVVSYFVAMAVREPTISLALIHRWMPISLLRARGFATSAWMLESATTRYHVVHSGSFLGTSIGRTQLPSSCLVRSESTLKVSRPATRASMRKPAVGKQNSKSKPRHH